MPYPGFRKLTITLTIVVIVANPSCGFALHRKRSVGAIPGPTTDLASQESLQVKSVKRPNDIRQGEDADTNKAAKIKYWFTSEPKAVEITEVPTFDGANETANILDTTAVDIDKMSTTDAITILDDEAESTSAKILSETNMHKVKTVTSPNSTVLLKPSKRESFEEIAENLDKIQPTNNSQASTTKTDTLIEPTEAKQLKRELEIIKDIEENEDEVKITKDMPAVNDQVAIDSEATQKLSSQKERITNATTVNIKETENKQIETEFSTTSFDMTVKSNILSSKASTSGSSSNAESKIPKPLGLESKVSQSASTVVEVKVTKDPSSSTIEPSWKKYSTIERKRVGNSEESSGTEKEEDSAKAESIHTTLPIPSLEMLREDLLSNANHLSTVQHSQTGSVTVQTDAMPTLESIENTQSETLATVSSRRAGFLDLSKKASEHHQEMSTDKNTDYKTLDDIESTDIETQEIKKVNAYESQSQLVEDAMKEELLKEENINDREENSKRYEKGKDNGKPIADARSVDLTNSQAVTDDTLSVQPINQDRRTTLYTVGPNYKPMKRIDVQPAKPFVRDPDDNSWRNESISSLGIVFKPKNSSSKSFKEVLKTKTETEFNNLQEKDNKEDTPELRERLEKIAEVRKSKKKRIDKFGEVVYTDYEEGGSAEGTTTPKATVNTSEASTLSSKTPENEVTSPMTTTEREKYWKNKLETISKEEMFKDLGLDILTTEKPKKPYNLAEYYDTTDEYDADYVTLPKIDIKKFTMPFKSTFSTSSSPSMTPPTTRILPPRFPERKPTVQYFPPTTKPQKVNVNDYDVDFERRVNFYTLKEQLTTLPPVITTDEPVATDQPEIRPAAKPFDFTMFTPQSPESLTKHVYMSEEQRVTEPQNFVMNNGNLNRGSYVIKHYKDFLNDATRDEDGDRSPDFVPFTEAPTRGVTLDELARATAKAKTTEEDYDYDSQFRKVVLSRFVDNFNQNSDRFKVDFPVLFNTSVVHRSNDDQGRVLASSSTFMKRLYGSEATATRAPQAGRARACEPHCELTVELSPAYELHYYVPEQEEKEEAERRPAAAALPYRYKL